MIIVRFVLILKWISGLSVVISSMLLVLRFGMIKRPSRIENLPVLFVLGKQPIPSRFTVKSVLSLSNSINSFTLRLKPQSANSTPFNATNAKNLKTTLLLPKTQPMTTQKPKKKILSKKMIFRITLGQILSMKTVKKLANYKHWRRFQIKHRIK